jgi:hypothetical protein
VCIRDKGITELCTTKQTKEEEDRIYENAVDDC